MSTSSHAVTNPRGRYRLSGIPGGEIVLQASRSGYRAQQTLPLTVSDSSVRIDFTLTRAIGDSASRAVYPPKPCHLEPADSSK